MGALARPTRARAQQGPPGIEKAVQWNQIPMLAPMGKLSASGGGHKGGGERGGVSVVKRIFVSWPSCHLHTQR